MRRLIILAIEEGEDPEIDWEGDFAYYELLSALERAHSILENRQFEDDNISDQEDEEGV